MTLQYYTLDVFTSIAFGGNPLAVFVDAEGLSSRLMQQIAKELNLAETVFIGQSTAPNRFTVRIFTPAEEIPFAGHPTVGTALLLNELDLLEKTAGNSNSIELVLEQGVGDITVSIQLATAQNQGPMARFKTAILPKRNYSVLTAESAAEVLSLTPEQVIEQPYVASCGLPYHIVELRDMTAVSAAKINATALDSHLGNQTLQDIYLFCRGGVNADIRARMFTPTPGVPEDPATGSAASALVGTLAQQQSGQGVQKLIIEQGVEMERPSYIHTDVLYEDSVVKAVYVAGQAVLISEGNLRLPSRY